MKEYAVCFNIDAEFKDRQSIYDAEKKSAMAELGIMFLERNATIAKSYFYYDPITKQEIPYAFKELKPHLKLSRVSYHMSIVGEE